MRRGIECRLTLETFLKGNEAVMLASLHANRSEGGADCVTNSVTNPLGKRGQRRATVTNSVTKLRAIQGNEITTFWGIEGNGGELRVT